MKTKIFDAPDGPISMRLWLEDDGKLSGIEWHCPQDGCREMRLRGPARFCRHRMRTTNQGRKLNWICGNTDKCREAMRNWAIAQFYGFAKLFEERA